MDLYKGLPDDDDFDNNSNTGLLNQTSAQPSFFFTNLNLSPKEHIRRLNIFATCIIAISIFFWVWAVINTRNMDGVDLGIVSFFGSGVASTYVYYRTKCANESRNRRNEASGSRRGDRIEQDFKPIGIWGRRLIVLTYWIVCANYMLGAWFAFHISDSVLVKFAVYCIVFTVLWMMIALIGWMLIGRTMNLVLSSSDEGDEEDELLYGFLSSN